MKIGDKFHFPDRCLPVFIRPCHSGFPGETIENNMDKFETVLYVSETRNIEKDLGCIPENFEKVKLSSGDNLLFLHSLSL